MPRIFKTIIFFLSLALITGCHDNTPITLSSCDNAIAMQVCFSPEQNCTQMLVDAINAAQKRIAVQAYSFTSYPIAHALVNAARRGVDVQIIVDKSDLNTDHFSVIPYLHKQNIPLFVDDQVTIAHNKVMIFDDNSIETGSFNFTHAAQYDNAENMIIIHDPAVANVYLTHWYKRLKISQKLPSS
jgi:phosphatidylserine/phosphatidylglycerophosphate/cardiolipin synthase-like enzyme